AAVRQTGLRTETPALPADPEPDPAAPAPTTRAAAAPPPPQRVTAPAAATLEPAPEAEPAPEEGAPLPLVESEPVVPFTAAGGPVEENASQPGGASTTALLVMLGALLALALAIWGFVAIGRRKTVDRRAAAISSRPGTSP